MAEEKKKNKKENTLENRCPSCRASIKFNAKLQKWKCEYCGSEFTLEEMKKHTDNASTEKKNKKGKRYWVEIHPRRCHNQSP